MRNRTWLFVLGQPDNIFVADIRSFHLHPEVGHKVEVSGRGSFGFVRIPRRFEYRHFLFVSLSARNGKAGDGKGGGIHRCTGIIGKVTSS